MRNEFLFKRSCDLQVSIKKFEGSVFEFARVIKVRVLGTHSVAAIGWKPPELGRIAINIDASVGGGLSAWALIARDHFGKLFFVVSCWGKENSPQAAEAKALAWAVGLAVKYGWTKVIGYQMPKSLSTK